MDWRLLWGIIFILALFVIFGVTVYGAYYLFFPCEVTNVSIIRPDVHP